MAELNRQTIAGARAGTAAIDEGLRAYMLRVYNYMAAGLAITGFVAYAVYALAIPADPSLAAAVIPVAGKMVAVTEFGRLMFGSPLQWVVIFAPLGLFFFMASRLHSMSVQGGQLTFWIYAAMVGASIAWIFMLYTQGSIARVFFITAASFGGLSLYGYTTQKDLSGWFSFLLMGVIGLIIAMVVNLWVASSALDFAISVIGVLVFAGLTAYHTQQIKEEYYAGDSELVVGQKAIIGALRLYLAFLNMFMFLLSLFGNRE